MNRSLALLSSAALLAVSASAQCFTATGTSIVPLMAPTATYPVDDEGRSSDILLPFTFPIGGQNWTHMVVESNGEIYLTMGTGVVGPATFGISGNAELTGVAGASPRICAFGGDLQGVAGLATWDILVDDTVAGQVKITWTGMRYYVGTQDFAMSITILDSGAVQFDYNGGNFETATTTKYAAVSAGNGIVANASQDLNAGGDTGTAEICYQNTWAPFDLENSSILLVPNGTAGFAFLEVCNQVPASHVVVGDGCYEDLTAASCNQLFTDALSTQTALQNTALEFLPTGNGYFLNNSAATWVTPVAPTVHTMTDDSNVQITPSIPFNFRGQVPTANLWVCSNGFVDVGGANSVFAYGSVAALNASVFPSFRANIDLNPATGGQVLTEEINGVLYVTYDNVPRFGAAADLENIQFQLHLASGLVNVVFGAMGSTSTNDAVIGMTLGGPVTDNPIDLATQLPYQVQAIFAMSLSASPTPVSTPSSGTLVDYTVQDAPAYAPGIDIGVVVMSAAPAALPLQVLDPTADPLCTIYVGSLDLVLAFVGPTGPHTVQFQFPANVPSGIKLWAQAVALVPGLNQFLGGISLSNGIESTTGAF